MGPGTHGTIRFAAATLIGMMVPLAAARVAADDAVWSQERAEHAQLDREVPDAVELFQFGERAMAEGNYAAAAVRFAEARAFAPKAALLARRHCQALIALEQRRDALLACGAALERSATEADQRVLGLLASEPPGTGDDARGWLAPLAFSLAVLGVGMFVVLVRRVRRRSRLASRVAVCS